VIFTRLKFVNHKQKDNQKVAKFVKNSPKFRKNSAEHFV